jgi:predicted phosphodiesterase
MDKIETNIKRQRLLKKLIVMGIVAAMLPVMIFFGVTLHGRLNSTGITVDERFKLSTSMKSPYEDTAKGSYMYSFVLCGDPHMPAEGDGLFPELDSFIRRNMVNFALFTGDMTSLGKEDEYANIVRLINGLTVSVYPALGNHDIYNNGWEYYWRTFGPSVYTFYGGNAKFIVIDTASGEVGDKQMEWIQKEIKSNRQPLLIVLSHMPIYGGDHGLYEFPKSDERVELIEMFEKYEVDFVLEGHYHGYVDITVNGVRYITTGNFTEGLLNEGPRHFLHFRVYGPNVSVDKILVGQDIPVEIIDDLI